MKNPLIDYFIGKEGNYKLKKQLRKGNREHTSSKSNRRRIYNISCEIFRRNRGVEKVGSWRQATRVLNFIIPVFLSSVWRTYELK